MSNYALTWQGQRASHFPMESMAHLSNATLESQNRPHKDAGTMANNSKPDSPARRGAPRQPRGACPVCGKKGLGNTYYAHSLGAYRQCRFCSFQLSVAGPAPAPIQRKPDFPRNKIERAVYEHYLSGVERGDLYRYVKLGKAGLDGPARSHSAAYAAWMAGKALASS